MTRYVVAGVDGSAASVAALRWAAAEGVARGLALRVVTVSPRRHGTGSAVGRRVAAAVAEVARLHPGLDVVAREIAGVPDRVLNDVGAGAELLVVATRGSGGFPGLRLGSVALGVASDAPCAVALVPEESGGSGMPEVAVGVDGHHPDARALDLAFETARRREARLRAVGAWRLPAPYDEQVVMPVEEDRAD
ncbi:universal stress protein [Actinacidiphila alni]|uniref:universal stress protein n=1 Tax=Actinacidiphila alni TaxID=380248 RepID=UPI003455B66C